MSAPSQRSHSRRWMQEKRDQGYRNVNMWLPPEMVRPLEKIAKDDMLPFATVVEYKLREVLGGDDL
jgi:hypothetical protein